MKAGRRWWNDGRYEREVDAIVRSPAWAGIRTSSNDTAAEIEAERTRFAAWCRSLPWIVRS